MTAAVPAAIHPIVPEDNPAAAFFPDASPALAAPFASTSLFFSTPGSTDFRGQTGQSSAADAR